MKIPQDFSNDEIELTRNPENLNSDKSWVMIWWCILATCVTAFIFSIAITGVN